MPGPVFIVFAVTMFVYGLNRLTDLEASPADAAPPAGEPTSQR